MTETGVSKQTPLYENIDTYVLDHQRIIKLIDQACAEINLLVCRLPVDSTSHYGYQANAHDLKAAQNRMEILLNPTKSDIKQRLEHRKVQEDLLRRAEIQAEADLVREEDKKAKDLLDSAANPDKNHRFALAGGKPTPVPRHPRRRPRKAPKRG